MYSDLNEEQQIMVDSAKQFCKKELSYEYVKWMDENVDFPPDELWQKFVNLGVFWANVPKEYGGQGISVFDGMLVYEQVCRASMSVA